MHVYHGSLYTMSTRSEYTVTINKPVAQVHQAYSSQDYWSFLTANLSAEPGQVHEFAGDKVTLFEVLPTTMLPEAVRAMVSQALKVKRVITIGELNGETVAMHFDADVKGTPVAFGGDFTLTGEGETTKAHYITDVTVNIPMMGAAIEPKVGEALGGIAEEEGRLTEQWINENL